MKILKTDTDAPKSLDKDSIVTQTEEMAKEISALQEILWAQKKHSLLIVIQGMDAAGKDGVTKAAFGACSPIGVNAVGFKKPTDEEFAHDFLWRVHKHTPAKGEIKVFIRSHYEDILIQRVHKWIDEDRLKVRMDAINAFEELIQKDNNTTILKFFLHISKERQLEKLQERKDELEKQWKHNEQDWEERKHWDEYMEIFQDTLDKCNRPEWHIIPSDQRWYRNYCATKIILETLKSLDLEYPRLETSK